MLTKCHGLFYSLKFAFLFFKICFNFNLTVDTYCIVVFHITIQNCLNVGHIHPMCIFKPTTIT